MLVPSGTGFERKNKNAEAILEGMVADYENGLKNFVKGGAGKKYWQIEGDNIYEIIGDRKSELDAYSTIAFLVAFCEAEDTHTEKECSYGSIEKTFGGTLVNKGFFKNVDIDKTMLQFFYSSITAEHRKIVFPVIVEHIERVYLLFKLYHKYKALWKEGGTDDFIQEHIVLGVVMTLLLNMGIRPYMLESDESKRKDMLHSGCDWVYELAELFHDFQTEQAYHMAGFGKIYESIRHQALCLQEKKEQKIERIKYMYATAMQDSLLSQMGNTRAHCDAVDCIKKANNHARDNERMLTQSIRRLDANVQGILKGIK